MKNNNIRVMQKNITIENILDNTIQNEENKIPKTDNGNSTISVNKYYDTPKNKLHLNNDLITSKNTITPEEFESLAKTGDIILLKTRYIVGACKRLFTCSKYDHIFFVYKKSGIITLIDTSIDGISQGIDWKTFKNSLLPFDYDEFTYRKLNIEEQDIEKKKIIEDNLDKNFQEFVKQVSNKHYYISIFNILYKGKPKEYEIKGEWEKAFGFSCGSFIAGLYSKLGIIKLHNTVHSYLPGDFAKDNRLNFLPGFSLGPKKIVVFPRK
jgi:hypothetical protein